jgi:hypothetical protein
MVPSSITMPMRTCSDVPPALLSTLSPVHSARWDTLDVDICLEQEPASVLAALFSWAESSAGESIFWLSDEAGTMSSTLARRFCQHVADFSLLGASFFVDFQSQSPHQPLSVIHSIAYQLAVHEEAFSRTICASLRKIPDLLTRRLQDQCTHLMVEPAATISAESPLFIVIDAFDMCSLDAQARGGAELVRALFDAVSKARGKYRVLLTSHISDETRRILDDLNVSQHRSLFRPHIMKCAPPMDEAPNMPAQVPKVAVADHKDMHPVPSGAKHESLCGACCSPRSPFRADSRTSSLPHSPSSPSSTKRTSPDSPPGFPSVMLAFRTPSGGSQVAVPIETM